MKFCVVTTVLNGERLIERTIRSILQTSRKLGSNDHIEYIIKDACSRDKTLEVIDRVLASEEIPSHIKVRVFSEKDSTMYEGITQAFQTAELADVYCYLNAGDWYSPNCFSVVKKQFQNGVEWLTGLCCLYDEDQNIRNASLPLHYSNRLIQTGFYGDVFPFIQQESTFWNQRLHSKIDWSAFQKFRYAGDFFLWFTFSHFSKLKIVDVWLGGFTIHEGQLTQKHMPEYKKEILSFTKRKSLLDLPKALILATCWYLPNKWKKKLPFVDHSLL